MMRTDPARMTAEQRLAELAELLAVGYQRMRFRAVKQERESRNQLEDRAPVEAQCDAVFNTQRSEVGA